MYSNAGYSLSKAGYDVWLFNARGTGLSRTYSIYSKAGTAARMNKMSWDFRYDLMIFTNFACIFCDQYNSEIMKKLINFMKSIFLIYFKFLSYILTWIN